MARKTKPETVTDSDVEMEVNENNDEVNQHDEVSNEEDDILNDPREMLLGVEQKLVVLPGATHKAASFQIEKEDHTLGNALRYFINKNPDVEFCGYTIPHPSETKMNVRIQIWDDEDIDTTAFDALRKGLTDMVEACDVVSKKFTTARDEFEAAKRQ